MSFPYNEFIQLKYIESNGKQYINTGVIPTTSTSVDITFEMTNITVNQCIFGCRSSGTVGSRDQYYLNSPESWETHLLFFSGGPQQKLDLKELNYKYHYYLSNNTGNFNNNANQPIHLLVQNNAGVISAYTHCKLYSFKIYDNDSLILDYVPAKRKSDNKVGMYDIVNDIFYISEGSGEFIAGDFTTADRLQYLLKTKQEIKSAIIDKGVEVMDNDTFRSYAEKIRNINSDMPIGSGCDYYGIDPPEGFLFADGSALSREEYPELFKVIGIIYGQGNGMTTFNLPDKRRRVTVMREENDTGFDILGKTGGSVNHTLTKSELPNISLTVPAENFSGIAINEDGFQLAREYGSKTLTIMNNLGNGQAMDIMNPYLVCNYIIKVK